MARDTRSIHLVMAERFALAQAYADDGAFHSAARVLRDLTDEVKAHAEACDRFLEDLPSAPRGARPPQ